ncbi:family 16 glycosylhydrolase [Polaribacter sp. PL03]|uniref:family 16 glycosylhydrolase n=1 Tax=Polaribacter sp. PL03 TaxID=3088353 RepID=UPI0029CC036F|nr:family 16 glycosylhydrolase [Polaribacter sp. PL03]MDX6747900.1 family 16 glycosylhydrolase [Polaribacter sp. PL03]
MKKFTYLMALLFVVLFFSCGENSDVFKGDVREVEEEVETIINSNYPLSDQMNNGKWVLNTDVSDEFKTSVLNEDKWQIQGKNDIYKSNFIGRAPSQFSVNNAIVEDDKLKILTKWEPDFNFHPTRTQTVNGVTYKYENITTAAVISKKQFTYGYMEIKCRAADAQITSAFWALGARSSEMDMFEMFGGHKTNADWRKRLKFNIISWNPDNFYYLPNGKGPVYTSNIQVEENTADDFHVYGFDWTSEYINIYIDGVLHPEGTILKSTLTNNGANPEKWVTDVPYWIWFDSETFPWLGIPEELDLPKPAEYQIEYIRVWQKN